MRSGLTLETEVVRRPDRSDRSACIAKRIDIVFRGCNRSAANENWNRAFGQNLGGDAAEQQLGQPATSVRRKYNKIRTALFRCFNDAGRGLGVCDMNRLALMSGSRYERPGR